MRKKELEEARSKHPYGRAVKNFYIEELVLFTITIVIAAIAWYLLIVNLAQAETLGEYSDQDSLSNLPFQREHIINPSVLQDPPTEPSIIYIQPKGSDIYKMLWCDPNTNICMEMN